MIFNLVSVIDWRVITAANRQQVDVDNSEENIGQAHMTTK